MRVISSFPCTCKDGAYSIVQGLDIDAYSRGKIARYYLAHTTQARVELLPSPDNGRPEHSEYRWVSFAEGRRLSAPRVAAVLDWAEAEVKRGHP